MYLSMYAENQGLIRRVTCSGERSGYVCVCVCVPAVSGYITYINLKM